MNFQVLGLCGMTEALFVQEHPPKKGKAPPQPYLTPPFAKEGFANFRASGPAFRRADSQLDMLLVFAELLCTLFS